MKHEQNGFLWKSLVNLLCNRVCADLKVIPDTSCSEYPSALEETDLSADVRSIALRG